MGRQLVWTAGIGKQIEYGHSTSYRCRYWPVSKRSDKHYLTKRNFHVCHHRCIANSVFDPRGFRFVEIAATHYNHLSAGLTQNGKVYMWGQCRGQSVTSPMDTRFHSINDVFSCFASPAVSWKMLQLGKKSFGNAYGTPVIEFVSSVV